MLPDGEAGEGLPTPSGGVGADAGVDAEAQQQLLDVGYELRGDEPETDDGCRPRLGCRSRPHADEPVGLEEALEVAADLRRGGAPQPARQLHGDSAIQQLPLLDEGTEHLTRQPDPIAAARGVRVRSADLAMDTWEDDVQELLDLCELVGIGRLSFDDQGCARIPWWVADVAISLEPARQRRLGDRDLVGRSGCHLVPGVDIPGLWPAPPAARVRARGAEPGELCDPGFERAQHRAAAVQNQSIPDLDLVDTLPGGVRGVRITGDQEQVVGCRVDTDAAVHSQPENLLAPVGLGRDDPGDAVAIEHLLATGVALHELTNGNQAIRSGHSRVVRLAG